jgi:dUTP pyrophosphatase
LSIVNAPGTVDAGYRGEILVCLINLDPHEDVRLRRGDRIAQLVVQKVEHARFVEVAELPASDRGAGGHGSTGGHARLSTGDGR